MRAVIRILAALGFALLAAHASAQTNPGFGGLGFPYVGAGAAMPTWGGNVYFNKTTPYCDPKSQGAIGNASPASAAADTAGINACIAQLEAFSLGGIVHFSSGDYCVNATITTTGVAPITFEGPASNPPSGATAIVSSCGLDITVFNLNSSFATIKNLVIQGKGTNFDLLASPAPAFGATQPAVLMGSGSGGATIVDSAINGGSIPLYCNGCVSPRVIRTTIKLGYGVGTGTLASAEFLLQNSSNPILDTVHIDQDLPANAFPTIPVTVTAYALNTAYVANQIVTMTGPDGHTYYVQATHGGTSNNTAQPVVKQYGSTFTDGAGGLVWGLVGPQIMFGLQMDSGTSEMWATNLDLGGNYVAAFAMTDTLGTGAPSFAHLAHVNFFGNQASINPNNGSDLTVVDSEIIGCFFAGCSTVAAAATWGGNLRLIGNKIFSDAAPQQGISLTGGVNAIISGNSFTGGNPAFTVAPGVTDFVFNNNVCGSSNLVCWKVQAGSSNRYQITGNDCDQAATCGIDLGTGNVKTVQQNGGLIRYGSALVGSLPAVNADAFFGNAALDQSGASNYGLLQDNAGNTLLNATATASLGIRFRIGNTDTWGIGINGGMFSRGGVDEGTGALYLGNASGGNCGTLWFPGFTSGQGHFTCAANAMGTPTWLLPTNSGTMAVSASAPLVDNASTGNLTLTTSSPLSVVANALTCPTCATTTNGGALSALAPLSLSAGGALSLGVDASLLVNGSNNLALNLGHTNAWTVTQQFTTLGLGTSAAAGQQLDINTNASGTTNANVAGPVRLTVADGTAGGFAVSTFGGNPLNVMARADGTEASPLAVAANETIGGVSMQPFNGVSYTTTAQYRCQTSEAQTASHFGNYCEVLTSIPGTTTLGASFRSHGDGHNLDLFSGASPTISSCGTSPSVVAGSNDMVGTITAGSGALSSCVMNFAKTWGTAPICTFSSPSAVASPTVATSATQLTIGGTSLTSLSLNYICRSYGTSFLLRRDVNPASNDNAPAFLDRAA